MIDKLFGQCQRCGANVDSKSLAHSAGMNQCTLCRRCIDPDTAFMMNQLITRLDFILIQLLKERKSRKDYHIQVREVN